MNPEHETKLAATPHAAQLRRPAAGSRDIGGLRPRHKLRPTRVGVAYLLLALAIGGAVAGVILSVTNSSSSSKNHAATATASSANWSTWKPVASNSVITIRSIAAHVAPEYRLKGGQQLAAVIPKPSVITTTTSEIPISAVVIHTGFPLDQPKDLSVGLIQRGAMYMMRGSGASGNLPGTPSVARGDLVRREALELALYSFTYVPSIDTVLVFVPPLGNVQRVVLLQRPDVKRLLDRPLADSLKPGAKLTATNLTPHDRRLVQDYTRYHFFEVKDTSQLPDGTVSFTLAPPA